MKILGLDQAELVVLVGQCAQLLVDTCGVRRDYGDCGYYGYFTGFHYMGGGRIRTFHIGDCPPEKRDKHFRLSREKALRLHSLPHHDTSFPSRNLDKGKFPGAIRVKPDILSNSGFRDPLADEALTIVVAKKAGQIDIARMESLIVPSENPYIRIILTMSLKNPSILQ